MSTRAFWKIQSGKDKSATPSTTPSTSQAEGGSDSNMMDQSSGSIRNSDDKSFSTHGILTAAALESGFLWKQPSKRRIFGGSTSQKRFFVLTPNELAYKEKDNEESEFKVVWKIGADVLSVEGPEEGSKDFAIVISEKGAPRSLKLSAADATSALSFSSAVAEAIRVASLNKVAGASSITASEATGEAADLTIEDVKSVAVNDSFLAEEPSVLSATADESLLLGADARPSEATIEARAEADETAEVILDAPLPIEEQPKDVSKPSVWFWGACCSAE